MASSSGSSGVRQRRRAHLPLILCPHCGWRKVVELTSHTKENPDRVFFTCPNQKRDKTGCGFYLWEEDYVKYLRDKEGITVEVGNQGSGTEEVGQSDRRQITQAGDAVKECDLKHVVSEAISPLVDLVKEVRVLLICLLALSLCTLVVMISIAVSTAMKK